MKRYLIALCAIILAACFSAFTRPTKKITNVVFEYNPPSMGDYSKNSVQNKANWTVGDPGCPDVDVEACSITVTPGNTNGGTQLGSGVSISASLGSIPGAYYVSGGANLAGISNKD